MTYTALQSINGQTKSDHLDNQVSTINLISSFTHINGIPELNSRSLQLAIVKLIDDEYEARRQRRNQITILGINPNTQKNELNSIDRLFKYLKQEPPLTVTRLYPRCSNIQQNYPGPIICELRSEYDVQKIIANSFRLRSNREFKNVYINKNYTLNQRILESSKRKKVLSIKQSEKNNTTTVSNAKLNQNSNNSAGDSKITKKSLPNDSKIDPTTSTSSIKQSEKTTATSVLHPTIVLDNSRFNESDDSSVCCENNVVVKTKDYYVYKKDLLTLHNPNRLNDTIINSYFDLLTKNCKTKCFALSSFSFLKSRTSSKLSKWYAKNKDDNYDFYLLPIFDEIKNHWSLIIINTQKRCILHYDPLFESSIDLIRTVKNEMSNLFVQLKNIKNWANSNKQNLTIPKQNNSYDCGVFICLFGRYVGQSKPTDFSQQDILQFRKHMELEITDFELKDFDNKNN